MGIFDRFKKNEKTDTKPEQEAQNSSSSGNKLNLIQCAMCGSNRLKKVRQGEYVCEHCGNRYVTDSQNDVKEATDKELFDLFVRANKYYEKGDKVNELKTLLEYKDRAWDNVDYVIKLGRSYRRAGYNSKAIECYDRAIELNPGDAMIYCNLGAIYFLNKDFAKASSFYEKSIHLIESDPVIYTVDDRNTAYANYGAALVGCGRPEEGESYIRKAESNGYKKGNVLREFVGLPLSGSDKTEKHESDSSVNTQDIQKPSEGIRDVIPARFLHSIDQLVRDYGALSDEEMWEKYDLRDIWFEPEDYSAVKKQTACLLGFLIVNYLVGEGYIIQLDWKDEDEILECFDDQESFWEDQELKIVQFDLDNDQYYLAKVPKNASFKYLFEVTISDFIIHE